MTPYVDGLKRRGVPAVAVDLKPSRAVMKAERAVALFREQVPDVSQAVLGGHSYGGRVASLLAADVPCRGLVLFSYPLHAPGKPEAWRERTAHWRRIACPVLHLIAEEDRLVTPQVGYTIAKKIPGTVHTFANHGHYMLVAEPGWEEVADTIVQWLRANKVGEHSLFRA